MMLSGGATKLKMLQQVKKYWKLLPAILVTKNNSAAYGAYGSLFFYFAGFKQAEWE
jgi:hypothetical protein